MYGYFFENNTIIGRTMKRKASQIFIAIWEYILWPVKTICYLEKIYRHYSSICIRQVYGHVRDGMEKSMGWIGRRIIVGAQKIIKDT